MNSPDLSICIVNWNTRVDLEQSLVSLAEAENEVRAEVIVVDNASQDGSPDMVRSRFPGVMLIEGGGNLGFARGYNLAASRSSGRHLLILNPDTVVHAGALEADGPVPGREPRGGRRRPPLAEQ